MKFEFIQNDTNICLPLSMLDKLGQASDTELRVLLYAAAVAGENGSDGFSPEDIQRASALDLTDVISALQFWRGAGVLAMCGKAGQQKQQNKTAEKTVESVKSTVTVRRGEMPHYTGEEIESLFDKHAELHLLIDECQKLAGKMFNPLEINKLVALYDYMGLSSEYILSVYAYCKNKGRQNVPYVEKTALNLYDEGIDDDEKLRCYLKEREVFDSQAGKIRRIFGLGGRALTKREEGYIKNWTEKWSFSDDMIEYAYELTVHSTNKPSLPYANKIMEGWHKAGITSVDQAKESSFEYKKAQEQDADKDNKSSFDTDEFFEAALKKSYENLGIKPQD